MPGADGIPATQHRCDVARIWIEYCRRPQSRRTVTVKPALAACCPPRYRAARSRATVAQAGPMHHKGPDLGGCRAKAGTCARPGAPRRRMLQHRSPHSGHEVRRRSALFSSDRAVATAWCPLASERPGIPTGIMPVCLRVRRRCANFEFSQCTAATSCMHDLIYAPTYRPV